MLNMNKNKKTTKKEIEKMIDENPSLGKKLEDMGLSKYISKKKKKRQGISTAPIFKSLENSSPTSKWGNDWLAVGIDGGRILTYNEMFSILQYRKYEAFRYKKICREVISRAIKNNDNKEKMPYFDGPTKLTLIRVGKKEMDLDSLPVVFKYFIDSLKREGIIDDDNPNTIVDIDSIQGIGEWRLGLKLERIDDWKKEKVPTWNDLIKI